MDGFANVDEVRVARAALEHETGLIDWLHRSFRSRSRSHSHSIRTIAAALLLLVTSSTAAGPSRYGHSDRVERHMLPAVTTGPLDPAWSPDGRWIAFSMRGDIWKVPAEGGTAIALTKGPAYHFEPAWSPDGKRIALTFDADGNLDIGIMSADGGDVQRITSRPQVDVEPTWSKDGGSLYFAGAVAGGGGFRIFRHDLATHADTMIVAGFQPSVSPDGKQLAYVASVQGKLGTGGLWVRGVAGGEARLVQYEETEYRMKPVWTQDGQAFLYVSDAMGSNDVAVISANGGNPTVLTADARDEYSPSPNPAGDRFAFVSNRSGPMVLYTAPIGGGPLSSWRAVGIKARWSRTPTGRVRVRVLGPDGQTMPARIYLSGSDGRAYAPDGGFHRVIAATETHYFHTTGEFEVEVPAGSTTIEALRGFEYKPATTTIDVAANGVRTATLQLTRLIDLPARGWYSGDTHLHDLHQGSFGLTHKTMFDQVLAEDIHVANTLVHMDGTRLMGRWDDLTGKPHPLSTATHILQYGEEFRGGLGHIGMIGIHEYVLPFTAGAGNTAYAQHELEFPYLDGARAQGGLAGFMHPYLQRIAEPDDADNSLIPVDIALGKGDFYDVATIYSDEIVSSEMYYRFLNCGFRLPATSGSDNFSDVYRDPPPGADRAYVQVEGPLTMSSWLDGIRSGHTFGSTGPLLFLTVNGKSMGDELRISSAANSALRVHAEAVSIAPLDSLQVIVNGKAQQTIRAQDRLHITFDGDVALPEGGWVAARVLGPASKYVTDSYAFAQTTPVYVVTDSKQHVVAEDGKFLADVVAALAARTERSRWRTPAEHDRFKAALDSARAVYQKCAAAR